ncbi:MAG: hypothetical protein LPL00_07220 [Alphaproteobacteria bacterium]|nr:hypothetical protein [Alphaproteobacteria bacterium]MDX5369355.1 hypothetical protein [Alphaproteobacteria bacterium]MDX5464036.1 hypothetical protein [Alphaproteobacteria bacterium]
MTTALLSFLHFIGLAAGIGLGFASLLTGMAAGRAEGEARVALRRLMPRLANGSLAGLALLWVSGGLLVWSGHWQGLLVAPVFHLKLAAVVVLTVVAVRATVYRIGQSRAGAPPDPARMRRYGMAMQGAALAAVLLATIQFS